MKKIDNFYDGKIVIGTSGNYLKVDDPSKGEIIGEVTLSNENDFNNIVNRIEKDKEFKKRQNFVGLCANILKNLGLIKIFNNKIFYLLHPYMKLEITRRNLYEKN